MDSPLMPECSGTFCRNRSIGVHDETIEIPTWRHPKDRLGYGAFDIAKSVYFCAEHEQEARAERIDTALMLTRPPYCSKA
jgi:hypothetical protein